MLVFARITGNRQRTFQLACIWLCVTIENVVERDVEGPATRSTWPTPSELRLKEGPLLRDRRQLLAPCGRVQAMGDVATVKSSGN